MIRNNRAHHPENKIRKRNDNLKKNRTRHPNTKLVIIILILKITAQAIGENEIRKRINNYELSAYATRDTETRDSSSN